jgi:hypothetical protein
MNWSGNRMARSLVKIFHCEHCFLFLRKLLPVPSQRILVSKLKHKNFNKFAETLIFCQCVYQTKEKSILIDPGIIWTAGTKE